MFRHFTAFSQLCRRTVCTSARRQAENKVPLAQRAFQDSGMPVHLKGGSGDALLYRLTMGLTVLGSGYVLYQLVSAAVPEKKQ